ncbi:MAG: hypothetical protein HKO95_17165 [Rhodobacteraceae bacterium]|nr:hypothetical protein [Paracoccaceae bacterium]NNK68457.1 hypothetical protein [Paracoccaceae bacterium]
MPRKPAVWSSTLTHNTTRNSKPIGQTSDRPLIDYINDYKAGRTVAAEDAPTSLFLKVKDLTEHEKCHFPDAFVGANRILIISPAFHTLLQKFDLGPTQFFDVPLYEYDRTTLRPERYFVMQVNAVKDAVVPEESTGIKPWDDKYLPLDFSQGEFAVRSAALDGPDLWWDANIIERLFFSDRLKRAIKDNRIHASVWGWKKCRILD